MTTRILLALLLLGFTCGASGDRGRPVEFQAVLYRLAVCGQEGRAGYHPVDHVEVWTNVGGWHLERADPPDGRVLMPVRTVPYRVRIVPVVELVTWMSKLQDGQVVRYEMRDTVRGCPLTTTIWPVPPEREGDRRVWQ